jgi:sulfur-oxidizing protein SoxY
LRRRIFLQVAGAVAVGTSLPAAAQATRILPAQDITPLLERITGGKPVEKKGVRVELPSLAENGNSVPLRIQVDSPMSATDRVTDLHVFAERNPRPLVAAYHFGPAVARAQLDTRIRLAVEQRVLVVASLSGGRFLAGEAHVVVTSAACLDEGV